MSTTLPNSPMMLDSTGRSIVQKLQGIIDALGGGGGGDMVMPPEYDPDLEDSSKGYFRGQYVTYNESLYKCKQFIYVTEGTPAGPFDDTKWDEITDLFNEFFQLKPGVISDLKNANEIFNDYLNNTISGGQFAHAEGLRTTASNTSHAEGMGTVTTGSYCHAEGGDTNAGGPSGNSGCHAEGYNTQATGYCTHSEGHTTVASGNYSHAEGYYTQAKSYSCHSEGYYTEAGGSYSHAEGYYCKTYDNASYSHAEGYQSEAKGSYAHAEGYQGRAYGYCSKASGMQCSANGTNSEAGGYGSIADGTYSKADGYYCNAGSMYEHAIGRYNKTYPDGGGINYYYEGYNYRYNEKVKIYDDPNGPKIYQCTNYNGVTNAPATMDMNDWTIIGEYIENTNNTLLFSIGNGSSQSFPSNAFEIFKDGRTKINGQTALALDPPSADGTYTLKCTVSDGAVTYSWVADPV